MKRPRVRCEVCGERLNVWNGELAFVDGRNDSYPDPEAPNATEARFVCDTCPTAGYCVPFRDLVTESDYAGWISHLLHKRWFAVGLGMELSETLGIAQALQQEHNERLAPKARVGAYDRPAPSKPDPVPNDARRISIGTRARVMERDGFKCRRCGHGPPDSKLVIDHIVPVAKGGTADESNLQALCRDCNAGKSDRQPHAHDFTGRK